MLMCAKVRGHKTALRSKDLQWVGGKPTILCRLWYYFEFNLMYFNDLLEKYKAVVIEAKVEDKEIGITDIYRVSHLSRTQSSATVLEDVCGDVTASHRPTTSRSPCPDSGSYL